MSHDRRFRFGVHFGDAAPPSAKEFFDQVRAAEDLGYSTVLFSDHLVGHPLAPMTAMVAAAGATSTLRVGTGVLGNDYKHPAVLATEAATLDLLSDGRLELGIGAGWMTADYEQAGFPLDSPRVRIERLAESVQVIKLLMAAGPATFHGTHYRIDGLDGEPKPVQRPHPPILIGGGGRKILSLAAREADIVALSASLVEGKDYREVLPAIIGQLIGPRVDEKLGWIQDAAGPRFDDLELCSQIGWVVVTDDARGQADAFAPAMGITPEAVLEVPAVLIGTVEGMIEQLQARRERWKFSYFVVTVEAMPAFAPVVARLAGG
jgi:probable F420-dependent oxidoreductase